MINNHRLVKLTQDLVRINSENPGSNEAAIAVFTADFLRRLKIPARVYEFEKNRANVVATIKGQRRERTLLITPHLDTVPAGKSWKVPAFAGKIINGKLYGLGATDCKCNLACSLEAIESLVEEGALLDYNLCFAATADEEAGSGLGLIPLLDKGILKPDAALVLDADDFGIIVAQKGLIHVKVTLKGIKAHGAYPWRGKNAIDMAADILQEVRALAFSFRKNKYLHSPTVNCGTIRGGDKVNVVADWCEFELDFRFLPGTRARMVIAQLRKIIRNHSRTFGIQIQGIQQPYEISESHPLVANLSGAMRRCGVRPCLCGSEGATTISFFQEKGIPAVASGFGVEGCAHIADEYVYVKNLYKGARVLEEFLRGFRFQGA